MILEIKELTEEEAYFQDIHIRAEENLRRIIN